MTRVELTINNQTIVMYGTIDLVQNEVNFDFVELPQYYYPVLLGIYTKDREVSFKLISNVNQINNGLYQVHIYYPSHSFSGYAYNINIDTCNRIKLLKSDISYLPPGDYFLLEGKMRVYSYYQ